MKWRKLFPVLLIILIVVPLFGIILPTSSVVGAGETMASSSQSGLIKVALTKNVAPRGDWSNGTLYHLRILQKFIPINITVITDFATLGAYQVLFLNMLNISNTDITTIADWVNDGGFLVCIGQSGRYTENGEERTSHPFERVLGITLNGWARISGAEVRQILINNTWHWWTSDVVYDVTNNGDGLYHEEAHIYYIPKSECANVTLNGATQLMSCRDKNINSYFPPFPIFPTYEEPFLTTSTYGSGKAFFIAADAFYRLVWKPPNENFGIYRNKNALVGGYWFRFGLLWQILYAVMLDCFSEIPLFIATSMPSGFYTAMSFGIKTVGYGAADNDTADDYAYGNLTQYWKPQLFDMQPSLKGWFWGFWLMTKIINGTTNATNIVDFVKGYGYAGSRSHTGNWALQNYVVSSEVLRDHGFEYEYEGSAGGTVIIRDLAALVRKWNFTDIFYLRRISGRSEHGAEISCIPYPISNHTGLVNFFAQPYAVEGAGWLTEWRLLISNQKILGENYGIGGYCMGNTYASWIGSIPNVMETIDTFINDDTVWKTNGSLFADWWNKRWKINMTDFSANSTHVTASLQTPDIRDLTLLVKGTRDIYNVTIDGVPLTPLRESNRIIIPELSQGAHKIVARISIFNNEELEEYNNGLRSEGKPYVEYSTQNIKYLSFAHSRLSLTLDIPANVTAKLKVCSLYPPRQAFSDGQPISFTYSANITTMLIPYAHVDIYYAQPKITRFSSSKPEYKTGESVTLTLEIYGDHSTSETVKWLARVTALDEAKKVVDMIDQETETSTAVAERLYFTMKNLSQGIYTITGEMLDPEASENVLAMDNLTISVTEAPTAPLVFDTFELEKYNDELRSGGLPYVEESTQTVVDLTFSNIYQRLSIDMDVHSGVNTQLKVCSLYPPRQAFSDGQPISFTYSANITTMLIPYAHVDIYYAQPKITEFTSSKSSYEHDEEVELALKVYGDYATSEIIKWFTRFTVEDETGNIAGTMYEEIELAATHTLQLQPVIGKLAEGTYTVTAEILDPEAENILETRSLNIKATPAELPLPLIISITAIVALIGVAVAVNTWYRLKKPKDSRNQGSPVNACVDRYFPSKV